MFQISKLATWKKYGTENWLQKIFLGIFPHLCSPMGHRAIPREQEYFDSKSTLCSLNSVQTIFPRVLTKIQKCFQKLWFWYGKEDLYSRLTPPWLHCLPPGASQNSTKMA